MPEYVCIRDCYHSFSDDGSGKKVYKVGEAVAVDIGTRVPRHFVLASKFVPKPAPIARQQLRSQFAPVRAPQLDPYADAGEHIAGEEAAPATAGSPPNKTEKGGDNAD